MSWQLADDYTTHFELGHERPLAGCELKTVNVGGGVAVTSYIGEEVVGDYYPYSLRALRVNSDLSIDFGPETVLSDMDLNYPADQSGLVYAGNDVVVQAGRQPPNLRFFRVDRGSLTLTQIAAAEGSAGVWDVVVPVANGQGYGFAYTDNLTGSGYEIAWFYTDGYSVDITSTYDPNVADTISNYVATLGRGVLTDSGIAVPGALDLQPNVALFDVDWSGRTISEDPPLIDLRSASIFYDETFLLRVSGTSFDALYSDDSDGVSLVRGVPTSATLTDVPETPVVGDLAQATQPPYAHYLWMLATTGARLFTWMQESSTRVLSHWSGLTRDDVNLTDVLPDLGGSPTFWLLDSVNLVDMGSGLFVVVYTSDRIWDGYSGNAVIWRAGRLSTAPLRQNQRDDIRQNQHTSRQLTVRQRGYL